MRLTVDPGATVGADDVSVMARTPEAPAAVAPATSVAADVAKARLIAVRRRRGDIVIRP
jgi:hypothetical protein